MPQGRPSLYLKLPCLLKSFLLLFSYILLAPQTLISFPYCLATSPALHTGLSFPSRKLFLMKLVCPVAMITDSLSRVKDEDVWQHKMVCLLKLRDLGQPTSAPTLIS